MTHAQIIHVLFMALKECLLLNAIFLIHKERNIFPITYIQQDTYCDTLIYTALSVTRYIMLYKISQYEETSFVNFLPYEILSG